MTHPFGRTFKETRVGWHNTLMGGASNTAPSGTSKSATRRLCARIEALEAGVARLEQEEIELVNVYKEQGMAAMQDLDDVYQLILDMERNVQASESTRVQLRAQYIEEQAQYLALESALEQEIQITSEQRKSWSQAADLDHAVNGWTNGYAFILSFFSLLWTICSFDSSVHISEEASNAATAVPWAIISAIGIAGLLGWAINVSLAFCMGTDLEGIISSPIGQPMARIFFNSFGQNGTLALWAVVVLVQYMMGSSMVLAASRQSFAFSRDGALPFSSVLYRMNSFTGPPANTVWFVATIAILLGLLSFAGAEAINAIFAISVTVFYVAYSILISSRFIFNNDFKPGPFSLGVFPSSSSCS